MALNINFDPRTNPHILRVLKWVAYPSLYVFFFCLFAYWSFPYERLKQRIVAGYNASQAGEPAPKRMVIGDASWSWRFPGVVLSDVEIIGPKPDPKEPKVAVLKGTVANDDTAGESQANGDGRAADEEATDSKPVGARNTIHIEEVYAGVSVFPALFGTIDVDFDIEGFNGELSGTFVKSDEGVELDVEFDGVDPGQLPGVAEALQLPLTGRLSGTAEFALPQGKYAEAEGKLDVAIEELQVGDGKTKIRDLIALPTVNVGTLKITATATGGRLKLETLKAEGEDLDVTAEGRLRLRDPVSASLIESVELAFKFSDKYRDKNDTTRSLLGKPGETAGGAIEFDPQVKRAKAADGFYRWRVSGPLGKPAFRPDSAKGGPAAGRRGPARPKK